jgi:phosphatidylglycerol---prolipoprotein diacylglyceryl transferase
MASHGGILGMVAGTWWYARQERLATPVLLDLVASGAPMGILLGRLANFVNGELWGKPGEVPWAVIFPDAPRIDGAMVARHPSQLYEAGLEGLLLLLLILPIHARHRRPGLSAGVLLTLYAVARFTGEFWREPDFGHPPYFGWMNKGQALSIPVLLIGLGIAAWAWRRGSRDSDYIPPELPPVQPPAITPP